MSGARTDGTSDSVAAIAGAIAEAVREGINRTLTPQQLVSPDGAPEAGPSESPISNRATGVGRVSLYQRVSGLGSVSGASSYHHEIRRPDAADSFPSASRRSANKRF